MTSFSDPWWVLRVVAGANALAEVLGAAHLLATIASFAPGGLLDWKYARRSGAASRLFRSWPASFGSTGVAIVALAKALCCIWIAIASVAGDVPLVPLAGVVIANALIYVRAKWFLTAADAMGRLTSLAVLIAVCGGSRFSATAGLCFIAGASTLSYGAAGVKKIRQVGWRSGRTLSALISGKHYGHARVASWMRGAPALSVAAARLVVVGECLFPLVIFLPPSWAAVFLLIAVVAHSATAVIMGLNTFLLAFPATYPAVFFTNLLIHRIVKTP